MCLVLSMPSCGLIVADRIHLQCFEYDFQSRSIPLITALKACTIEAQVVTPKQAKSQSRRSLWAILIIYKL